MANSGYTVTRSNYTLKKFHMNTKNGVLYERDFMTTNNLGGMDSGSIPNTENGFKMVSRSNFNAVRQHHFGKVIVDEDGNEKVWTLESCPNKEGISTESEIKINIDKSTLLSHAYFGSCVQLVQTTIKGIINNFPAEMYSTEEVIEEGTFSPSNIKYILNNDFNIDIITLKLNKEVEKDANPLRYFYLKHKQYVINQNGISYGNIENWKVEDISNSCECDKEITISNESIIVKIRRYWLNGSPIYLTDKKNLIIRPSESNIEDFFNSTNDLQRVLLDRGTEPLYTAFLDFPHETNNGIETYKKSFTWPSAHGYNIAINGIKYTRYVNDLLTLADFYDEYNTDNLWKNMTHDSIKNMDISFTRNNTDEGTEDYREGTTKLQGLLWAYGRQFDEIKKYIDNIKSTNNISYSGDGNIPDYFLTDILNLSGWEICSSINALDPSGTTENLFIGYPKKYDNNDTNVLFLKNLKLNSKNILSKKGTRRGVEELLGLFGYASDDFKGENKGDYTISEFVRESRINSGNTVNLKTHASDTEYLSVEEYEYLKNGMREDYEDALVGLPFIYYFYYNEDNKLIRTIIPWFTNVSELDGNPYFQMYGGWEKVENKYGESIGYLYIVKNISDLKGVSEKKLPKNSNNIIYVSDIDDIKDYFPSFTGSTIAENSHYFILANNNDKYNIGENGWHPVTSNEEVNIRDYMKEIIDEYRGNNPHTGYGNYDDGEEYFNYFKEIFHDAIKNKTFSDEAYTCNTDTLIPEITEQGFTFTESAGTADLVDNKKCYYFYNNEDDGLKKISHNGIKYTEEEQEIEKISGSPYGIDVRDSGTAISDTNTIFAEPSIINTKKLLITFRLHAIKEGDIYTEKEYIKKSVLPYLAQMIPSTTILHIKFV